MTNKPKQRRYNKSIWEESYEPNFDFKKSKCFGPSPQITPSVYTVTNSVWRSNKKSRRNSKLNRRKEWKKKFSWLKNEKWKKFINTAGCFIILSGFLYQSSTFLSIFYNYPTMVEFNVANEVQLDFPAVTVCNSNPVRYKIWCKENPSICIRKPGETLEEIRVRHAEEYDKLSRQKRIELGNQYKDFVLYAEYEDAILTEPFAEYYDYEFTNCFTFNSRWGEQQEVKPAVLFNPVTGKASELLLCLNMDVDNYSNMTDTPSGRVKMVIHANDIVPNPTYDAASLEAGAFYSYGIQKVMTKLLESPYQTKCRNYEEEREIRTGAKMSQKKSSFYERMGINQVFNTGEEMKESFGHVETDVTDRGDESVHSLEYEHDSVPSRINTQSPSSEE
ncbi:FMRFamide-activated amiloride-sensitive sodium channel-like [Parasteatoda tepidariorum]|uniref:FMRFamide-activated amiloride-sensitive sodium channel-like n=1 Tax=Parasteatoda tepidariorum TaxID=114398 RepID=UPI0039BD649D